MSSKFHLNLPKTAFPLRINSAQHELKIHKAAAFDQHYTWQQGRITDRDFVLHDGPPYANGDPHMGHLLNKVLKDITNRYRSMCGYRVHHRPGWDCHGLPIELKACQSSEQDQFSSTPLQIRRKARRFAEKTMKRQMQSFKRWGVMANWDYPYTTMDKDYEANQVGVFYEMYKKGCIYRGLKPVHWSPSSHTALAEAELEYHDTVSHAVYVKFPVRSIPTLSSYLANAGDRVYAAVWTTTPWTLVANRAICFHPKLKYSLLQLPYDGTCLLVCSERLSHLAQTLGSEYQLVTQVEGSALEGGLYTSPFLEEGRGEEGVDELPFLPGDHVTAASGTGLVHTAPAHGLEDFHVGLKHGLSLLCPVDDHGVYTSDAGSSLQGLSVLDEGSKAVVEMLRDSRCLLSEEGYTHRCPFDWRTKGPVIVRTTMQWFAAVGGIKAEVLQGVQMHPKASYNQLAAMLEGRQDWCISRQRHWGVPIPVFYHKQSGDHIIDNSTVSHIQSLFAQFGSDCWWQLPVERLLPATLSSEAQNLTPGSDTMDVWFDSGTSWATVLKDHGGSSDLYLEGSDQHRGWFQSSLITSYLAQGKAPYRAVMTHGFVLDGDGAKMSKSVGNVISPDDIITKENFGADVLRLWVASSDFAADVSISQGILQQTNDTLQKIRNTCRFMLGNLGDFSPSQDAVPLSRLSPLDRYLLHLMHQFSEQVKQAYDTYNYSRICHLVVSMVTSNLSSFYFDIIKDKLYCNEADNSQRRATQTALYLVLVHFLAALAPILPHLTEEAALSLPLPEGSVFKRGWQKCPDEWRVPAIAEGFAVVRQMRDLAMRALDEARESKAIRSSLEATACVTIGEQALWEELHGLTNAPAKLLSDVFLVSDVYLSSEVTARGGFSAEGSVKHGQEVYPVMVTVQPSLLHKCPRCWKHHCQEEVALCPRCHRVEQQFT